MEAAKVLVLMTSPLDKIVHALRVVECIKRQVPGLEITWVVRRVYEPLVAAFSFVDRTIVFRRSEAIGSFFGLVRQIRRDRYDFVLDFEGYARTGAMCFFARGGRKIGLASAREGAAVCYSELVSGKASDARHLLERFQDFASVFGLKPDLSDCLPFRVDLALPESLQAVANEGRRIVCLFPGRYKSNRAWPRMLDLARKIVVEREDIEVVLLGFIPGSTWESLPARGHDLQEKLSWAQLGRVLGSCSLAIANDNGPAQLAGALACPNLTLYSYVSPELRGSYPTTSCSNAALTAPGGDVSLLELDDVYAEVEKLLSL